MKLRMKGVRQSAPVVVALLELALLVCAGINDAHALAPETAPPRGQHEPSVGDRPPRDPAFSKALEECASQLGVSMTKPGDRGSRPPAPPQGRDREAMDACLKGKGVQRPAPPSRD